MNIGILKVGGHYYHNSLETNCNTLFYYRYVCI